jgi:microcystin-dependent protein
MAIPTNIIIMWSGAINEIPNGWLLCNGSSGTPNLRNRFVVGAGNKFSLDNIGGSKDAILPTHNHANVTSSSAGGHTHVVVVQSRGANSMVPGQGAAPNGTIGTTANGNHDHTFNTTMAGESGVGKNMPPYYALAYIMYGGE